MYTVYNRCIHFRATLFPLCKCNEIVGVWFSAF